MLWPAPGLEEVSEAQELHALPWAPPEHGPQPWPEPKIESTADTWAAAAGAEAYKQRLQG